MTAPLHVATLNIRNLDDRWAERQSLIYADMAAMQPDLLGLQEVVYVLQQDRLIGAAGEGRYREYRAWAGRPEYGNSLLVREPLAAEAPERLDLGLGRSALRVRLRLNDGSVLLMAVTHLHHLVPDAAERTRQAGQLLDWLEAADRSTAMVVVGDFNANPDEPAYRLITDAGYRSAHLEANGAEPAVTWPSGLVAPAMDTDGPSGCLGYIWVRGAVRVTGCRVVFDRPDAEDPTLLPSDHFGLSAHLEIG